MKVVRSVYMIKRDAGTVLKNKWITPILVNLVILGLSLLSVFVIFPIDLSTMAEKEIGLREYAAYLALNLFVIAPLSQGSVNFILDFSRLKKTSVGQIFDGYKLFFQILVTTVINTAVCNGLLLFGQWASSKTGNIAGYVIMIALYIAVIYFSVGFSQVSFLLYDKTKNPFKAIKMSFSLMKNNILKYISLHFSFILWYLGIMITGGIFTVWLLPYLMTARAVFYNDLIGFREDVIEEPKY